MLLADTTGRICVAGDDVHGQLGRTAAPRDSLTPKGAATGRWLLCWRRGGGATTSPNLLMARSGSRVESRRLSCSMRRTLLGSVTAGSHRSDSNVICEVVLG